MVIQLFAASFQPFLIILFSATSRWITFILCKYFDDLLFQPETEA